MQELVAHAYNPSYSGGRDQEDCGSKTVQANSLRETLSLKKKKKPSQTSQKKKKGMVEWLRV
jgi:hypothetical protein